MPRIFIITIWAGLSLLSSCKTEAPLATLKKLDLRYQQEHGPLSSNGAFFDYLGREVRDTAQAHLLQSLYLAALLDGDEAFKAHLPLLSPQAIASLDYHLGPGNPYRPLYQEQLDWYYQNRQGRQAIDLTALDTAGHERQLSDFDDKVVYIDTWASWCAPCMEQLPYLQELARQYAGQKDFVILTLSFDQSPERWKKALSRHEQLPNIVPLYIKGGMQSDYAGQFLISSIPHYALLGKDRAIVAIDAPKPGSAEIRAMLEEQLVH
ncbi:MAG: TlpA family protein disulfide reductase [Phaeodactylibacter sp.]|nr:TlpA family protein disulfide reductase [Phaeodactylibacter sp.]